MRRILSGFDASNPSNKEPTIFTSRSISNITTVVSTMTFNISWESNTATAPAGFKPAVLRAVAYLQTQFIDPITINITVGYGAENGNLLGGGTLGQSQFYIQNFTYSQIYAALGADAKTAIDSSSFGALSGSNPTGNGNFWLTQVQAKALGLYSANLTGTDGWVGLSKTASWTYDNSNGVAMGTYDFYGTVLHELTEVMGRFRNNGDSLGGLTPSYSIVDLFTFSASNVHRYTSGGYFSVDNGATNLGAWNTVGGGDTGDWASSVSNDACDAFSNSGVINVFSVNDLKLMDVIGYDPTGTTSPPPPTPPTPSGVSVKPVNASGTMTRLQAPNNSLALGTQIATFTQIGGTTSDVFTYTLGGIDATSFSFNSSTGTLSTKNTNLSGSINGKCYSITITANDVTGNVSSSAIPFNIVIGSSSSDTIALAGLSGIITSATTIVYGLSGNDTIVGTSMTGPIYFVGGIGTDTLTSGSGINRYYYSSTTETNNTNTDIITNFNVSTDIINISGLGMSSLRYAGNLGTTAFAKTYGWKVVSGNTFVYVNTGNKTAALASSNMILRLTGILTLSSNNFSNL
jgi:hypothetical protein